MTSFTCLGWQRQQLSAPATHYLHCESFHRPLCGRRQRAEERLHMDPSFPRLQVNQLLPVQNSLQYPLITCHISIQLENFSFKLSHRLQLTVNLLLFHEHILQHAPHLYLALQECELPPLGQHLQLPLHSQTLLLWLQVSN